MNKFKYGQFLRNKTTGLIVMVHFVSDYKIMAWNRDEEIKIMHDEFNDWLPIDPYTEPATCLEIALVEMHLLHNLREDAIGESRWEGN